MMFLEDKTNKSENEIRKLPYPKFKAILELHSDPETFLKPKLTKQNQEDKLKLIRQKNQELIQKAKQSS